MITDKSQAEQTTGIIPETHEYIRGSGKGAKSRYYLNVNGQRFHCDDDNYDDCKLIYAYKGQTATVWHHEGLAYEIEVGGQKVYEFHAQAQKFKATQDKRLWQLIWAVILFGLPSAMFYFINKIVIRDLQVIATGSQETPNPRQPHLTIRSHTGEILLGRHQQQTKAKLISSRMMVGGHVWRALFGVLGTIFFVVMFMPLFGGKYMATAMFLFIAVGLYYVASLPRQNAKAEVAIYQEYVEVGEDVGELSDYASSGFYNHMGVIAWILMIMASVLMCIALLFLVGWVFWLAQEQKGVNDIFVVIFFAVMFVLMLLVVFVVIKRAMNKRDLAVE